jgi:hypothetical protein
MADFLQVTAPCVVVKDESGAQRMFLAGAVLPAGLDGDHVKQLLDQGMVEEGQVVGIVEDDAFDEELENEDVEVETPAKSASKGDWEAFARSQGATDADLDGLTKDDLIAAYGD